MTNDDKPSNKASKYQHEYTDRLDLSPKQMRQVTVILILFAIIFFGGASLIAFNTGTIRNSLGCLSVKYQFSSLTDKAAGYRVNNYTLKEHSELQIQIMKALKANKESKCGYDEDAFRANVSI